MKARETILPVFVPHLGCPHDCVFCNQRRIASREMPADATFVRETIEKAALLPEKGRERQLAFYGGSFTAIPAREQESLLAEAYKAIEEGKIDAIRLSTRPDAISDEVLARLRRYGVKTVELGAQSLNDEVLRLSGRGHTAQDVVNASRAVKEAGFHLILQMMTGLPGDTPERSLATAESIIALQPDGVRIYPTVIVRDTALYDLWQKGLYREHTVEDAVTLCARLLPLFTRAGIPVIRVGLNPTDDLTAHGAVAGAYHPALGELVKSRVLRNRAEELFASAAPGASAVLCVHPSKLSQMTGQRRCNILYLQKRFSLSSLKVRPLAELSPDEIHLEMSYAKTITPKSSGL